MHLVRRISLISRLALTATVSVALLTGTALAADDGRVDGCTGGCGGTGSSPSITIQPPANISNSSFVARYLVNAMGTPTDVVISYSTDANFSSAGTTPQQTFNNLTDTEAETNIEDLPSGALIYYFATATNVNGSTVTPIQTVELGSDSRVTTLPVTNIGSTTATLNGRIESNGAPFEAGFTFGVKGSQDTTSISALYAGSLEPSYISINVGALKPDTTYTVQLGAGEGDANDGGGGSGGSGGGSAMGEQVTFTTKSAASSTAASAPSTNAPTTTSQQKVVATISRLAVGVRSALFQSGKRIHFVLDASAAGEVSLRVFKLDPKKRSARCKRVPLRNWIENSRSAGCRVILFPTTARMKIQTGSNKLTYRPLRPLTPGTYRATFKVIGDSSAKSVEFKVKARK